MTVSEIIRQIFRLPRAMNDALQRRRGRVERNAMETERLDRIRNPDKYRGK
jgi:hypothetical protein